MHTAPDMPTNVSPQVENPAENSRPALGGFANRSLTFKLVVAVSVLLALALIGSNALSVLRTRQALTQQTQESFGLRAEEVADKISLLLESYLRGSQVAALDGTVIDAVAARNASYTLGESAILADIDALDIRWRDGDTTLFASVLGTDPALNPASDTVSALRAFDGALEAHVETFVTDSYGATVASTQQLSDYYQADEGWWQAAWNNGAGAVYISEPEIDASANTLSLLIALPILGEDGLPIGVFRTTVEAAALVQTIEEARFGQTGHLELYNAAAQEIVDGLAEAGTGGGVLAEATVADLISSGEGTEVVEDSNGNGVFLGYSLVQLEAGVPNWTVVLRQDASEALAPVTQLRNGGIYITLIALALGILIAMLLARSLTRPIQSLVNVAERVGRGDLSQFAEVRSRDEIGTLATTFNTTITELRKAEERNERAREQSARLQTNVGAFLEIAMDIADGDFTKRGQVTEDELGNVVDAINLMVDETANLLQQVREAATEVAGGSSDMITTTDAIVKGAQRQAEEAGRVRAQLLTMVEAIRHMADTAATSTQAAGETLQAAQQGQAAVQDTLKGMDAIQTTVASVAERVEELSQRSREIANIIDSVTHISSQINLLSLSASLEAAGAGEAGRRFATVADEVRELAEDSAEATQRITSIIEMVQTELTTLNTSIKQSTREVTAGVQVATRAGERLEAISTISRRSADLAETISQVTQAQVSSAEDVGVVAESIAGMAEASQTTVVQGREAAEQLQRLATELNVRLSRFRLA